MVNKNNIKTSIRNSGAAQHQGSPPMRVLGFEQGTPLSESRIFCLWPRISLNKNSGARVLYNKEKGSALGGRATI